MNAPEPPDRVDAWITTSTVLRRLEDFGDHDAWSTFIERFRRPIVGYARRRGLADVDAQDVAQETLAAFAAAYRSGSYDKTRGRLSRWLFGIASKKLQRYFEQRGRGAGTDEISRWSEVADAHAGDPAWDEVWERAVLEQAMSAARGEFQSATWRVFEMLVLENRSVDDALAETGLSRNAVYIAKHRVLARVEALVRDCDEVA